MATTPEEVNRLAMPGMQIRAPWTPESGRTPTSEELRAYYSDEPEAITEDYEAPPEPVEAPVPTAEPWNPESGRTPSSEELSAFYKEPEPEPPPPEPVPLTPEEQLRQTPGILGQPSAEEVESRILGEERVPDPAPDLTAPEPVTPVEAEIEPWDPESGDDPTPEQLRVWSGLSAEDAPVRAVSINPINLPAKPLDDSPGRTRTALGNAVQSAGKLLSSVPKAIQLWFAPDTEVLGWMDEMDRIDAMEDSAERFDARVAHISMGMQKYGTAVNLMSAPIIDMYIEGPKNKGETLTQNRAKARAQFLDSMRKTVDRPLYKAGEAFDQAVRESFPTNPEYQDEWLTSKIPSGLGSVVGYMTVFALTKKPAAALTEGMLGPTVAATATTAGIGVTTQQAFAFEDALTSGAEIDEAFDAAFSGYTVASGMSEALPISRFFGRADAASGGTIKKTLIRMFKQGTEEGLQEGFQDIMNNLTAQELYDPERQLWGAGTGEAVGVGFTTGAIVEFIASFFPGRRRGTADRAPPDPTKKTLQDQLDEARAQAAAEGGDTLDQAEAASRIMAELSPEMRERQADTKNKLLAAREARVERNAAGEPLAALVQAESDIARLPFEQQAEVVAQGVAEEIAAAKELAFERAEEDAATAKAEETKEAEYQQELQKGEAQEELGERQEAAEAVQAEVTPTTIGEAIEPEAREGLERLKAAKIRATEAAGEVGQAILTASEDTTPQLEDQRADFTVTPEGDAIPKGTEEITIEAPVEPALPGERPVDETNALIQAKADQAATSPTNALPEPTEAQAESGNYKKGHLTAQDTGIPGVEISIENPKGSTREGPGWKQKMRDHYGYIKRTESAEGPEEQLDVFVGENLDSDLVFVVDQVNQNTGEFDEHKVMMGYGSQMDAVRAYKRNYSRKWKVGPVTVMTREQFTGWLERGDQTRPVNKELRNTQVASAGEVAAIAREQGDVVRFSIEDAPSSGSGAAAQAGMEVTPKNRVDLPFKDVVKRTPELQAAAKQLEAGEITRDEFDAIVNQFKPIAPYTAVPEPAATEDMNRALTKNKVDKIQKGEEIEDGHPVGLRLDIPAYRDHGVWVPTIHENAPGKGKGPLSYEATAVIDDAEFREDTHAIKVATGGAKAPSAVIRGNWSQQSEAETMAEAQEAMNDPSWTQVGFDPERHSYFFDRNTGEPIVSADRVIQVGGLVLAKNPKYGDKAGYRFRGEEAIAGFDFTAMTRSDRASLATHLTDRGYSTMEAAKVISDLQKGDALALDDVNVQSWVEGAQPKVVRVKDAKAAVKPLTDELTQLKPVIVTDPGDSRVPETLRRLMRDRRAMRAKGAYFNGKLYIFANNHETAEDIVRTLLHEGVAHQGLRALFKNDAGLNAVLDEVYASMSQEEIDTMRGRARAYANIDLTTQEGQRELAEEHIAHLAETDPQQTIIQQLVAKIRSMLRSVGMTLEFTNDDIVALLADARRELRKTVPLNRINVVSQVEVAETGEVIEVEERADIAIRQLDKRIGVIETLRGCAA